MRRTLATIAFILAGSLPGMTHAAEIDCAQEGAIRSKSGDVGTALTFRVVGENDETQFKLYWLDYDGNRKFYRHVFAGDTYRQDTYLTHPWLVTAPEPGGGEPCVMIVLPDREPRRITLD